MMSKSIFKSKTFWINAGAIVVGYLLNHVSEFHLDADMSMLVLGVLNILNRFFTNREVHLA